MVELNVIVSDGYDREVFDRALNRSEGLKDVQARLLRLLPHPECLLHDLFCLLFKLTTIVRPASELPASVLINRSLLEAVLKSEDLEALRSHTALNDAKASAATRLLAERIVQSVKEAYRERPVELAKAQEAAKDEAVLEALRRTQAHLGESDAFEDAGDGELADELAQDIEELETGLDRYRRRHKRYARLSTKAADAAAADMSEIPQHLEQAQSLAQSLSPGGDANVGAQARIELGEQIMKSDKLKRLARLVGAFREVAFEARRRRVVQSPQETHTVSMGAELERLLPAEFFGLRTRDKGQAGRGLRVEFLRRFAEKQLLQYELHAAASRGPMVICLDGSGSMHGAKELWGKAVALTLMEIARRERRRCLAVIFSSGSPLFEIDLLAKRGGNARAMVRSEQVLRFAEHFPGGGTDFEEPLRRAVEAVSAGTFKRGDIVFITDGFAPVSDELVARIERLKKRHRFKIRVVLVDVDEHESKVVERFADDIRKVSELSADSLADTFAAI